MVWPFVIHLKNLKTTGYPVLIMKNVFWFVALTLIGTTVLTTNSAFRPMLPALPVTAKPAPAETGIQFTEASWKDILKKAKAEKKIIFLDAYASWCGPCKMLQKNVFTKKAVGEFYNSKFINVKMDMEKGEGPALAEVYPLEAYPTLMYIDGNGRLLKKFIGAPGADDLISLGKSVNSTAKGL